jgi:hypothetical protein
VVAADRGLDEDPGRASESEQRREYSNQAAAAGIHATRHGFLET